MIGSERNSAFLKSLSNAFDERLVRARVAELLDPQLRVRALRGGGGGERRVDAVLGDVVLALELEGDERGAAVARELARVALGVGRLDLDDVRRGLRGVLTTSPTAALKRASRIARALALHEHLLVGLLREAGGGDRLVGGAGLAVAGVLVGQHPLPDGAAEHGGEDDEGDPAEDRALAVVGAPAARAGGEVVLLHVHHRASGARALLRGEPPSHRFGSPQPRRAALPPRVGVILRFLEQDDQEDDDDDERSDTDVHAAFIPGGGTFERTTPPVCSARTYSVFLSSAGSSVASS